MTPPTFRGVLFTGLPGFLREGFLPLGVFYVGLRLGGLGVGIVASAMTSILIYLYERRAGRDALLVRLSLAFVAVQSVVGLVAHSALIYLAQPVLANAVWGIAFLDVSGRSAPARGSARLRLVPVSRWFRQTEQFKRVYGVESVVWGVYMLVRSGLRLTALLQGSLESFLLVVLVTGTPMMLLLVAWSIRYAIRGLTEAYPEMKPPASLVGNEVRAPAG